MNTLPTKLVVLVCGSRDWTDEDAIRDRLAEIIDLWLMCHDDAPGVIHGGARGADLIAAEVARHLGFWVRGFPADWRVRPGVTQTTDVRKRKDGSLYDASAGKRRNIAMLDEKPDLVLAFQRNGSRGTQHTIDEARKRGIAVEVFTA